MKILKIIGFGALIWAVAFLIVCVFIGFKVPTDNLLAKITTLLGVLVATLLASRNLKPSSQVNAVAFGVVMVLTGAVLDAVVTTRFTGWVIFKEPSVLVGYLLIILTPLLAVRKKK